MVGEEAEEGFVCEYYCEEGYLMEEDGECEEEYPPVPSEIFDDLWYDYDKAFVIMQTTYSCYLNELSEESCEIGEEEEVEEEEEEDEEEDNDDRRRRRKRK